MYMDKYDIELLQKWRVGYILAFIFFVLGTLLFMGDMVVPELMPDPRGWRVAFPAAQLIFTCVEVYCCIYATNYYCVIFNKFIGPLTTAVLGLITILVKMWVLTGDPFDYHGRALALFAMWWLALYSLIAAGSGYEGYKRGKYGEGRNIW